MIYNNYYVEDLGVQNLKSQKADSMLGFKSKISLAYKLNNKWMFKIEAQKTQKNDLGEGWTHDLAINSRTP